MARATACAARGVTACSTASAKVCTAAEATAETTAIVALRGAAVILVVVLAGCSHMPRPHVSWPWGHRTPAPPQEVHEVTITAGGSTDAAPGAATASTAFPQYWKRNTLVIDMQGATGTGSIVLKPVPGTSWPIRLAFRVLPGQIGILEVRAAERMLLPITSQGAKPIDLEVVPGVYTAKTPQITVMWEPVTPPTATPTPAPTATSAPAPTSMPVPTPTSAPTPTPTR